MIRDKPLAISLDEGQALARQQQRLLVLTHTDSGYPMVRHARALGGDWRLGCSSGEGA